MKRFIGLLFVALLIAGAMLTPVTLQVNNSLNNGGWIADGGIGPVPPWPPSHSSPTRIASSSVILLQVADGGIGPVPPWPPSHNGTTHVITVTV